MGETCSAAYLRLLALPPLRLLAGLRSADGACVPRCLLQPSPRHLGSEKSQQLSTSSSFSSSHGCTSAGLALPHVLIPVGSTEPACFCPPCRDPSSAPVSTPLSHWPAAVSFRCASLSNVPVPSQRPSWRWKPEHPRWRLPEAEQHQRSGWSFPVLGALTRRGSALQATEEIRTKYKILCPHWANEAPNNVPRPARKQLSSPPPSRFTARSPVLLLLGLPFCSVLDRPLPVPPAGKRSCSPREDWLSDAATLTDPHHVTALLVERLT